MKRSIFLSVAGVVGACCALMLYGVSALDSWQDRLTDRLYLRDVPPQEIVIIGIDDEDLNMIGSWPWERAIFADMLPRLDAARAIGFDIMFAGQSRFGAADDTVFIEKLAQASPSLVFAAQLDTKHTTRVSSYADIAMHGTEGFVNIEHSLDGVVRTAVSTRGAMASFASQLGGHTTSTPAHYRVTYYGPEGTFPILAFRDVLAGKIPDTFFTDKIVLIGVVARSVHDTVITPFGLMSGVEYHANSIATLLRSSYATSLSPLWAGILMILAGAGIAECARATRRMRYQVLGSLVFAGGVVGAGVYAFSWGIIVPLLYLSLALLFALIAVIALQYVLESREKRFIRQSFQYYVSPAVIAELEEYPEKLALGGTSKEVAIMFTDIRGFTTFSEAMTPQELTAFLNEYLTAMTDIILDKGGVVDKYIGDAVMAFWGAPLHRENAAADACEVALRMMATLKEKRAAWTAQGYPACSIGIGINYGTVVVGNMGSRQRFDYTVIGDAVNQASRVEGLTKQYGVPILVTDAVVAAVGNDERFYFRELDTVRVKGKRDAVRLFAVMTSEEYATLHALDISFQKGRHAYARGLWDEALEHFHHAETLGSDTVTQCFIERTQQLRNEQPTDWQGVYTWEVKS